MVTPDVEDLELELHRKIDAAKWVLDEVTREAEFWRLEAMNARAKSKAFSDAGDRIEANIKCAAKDHGDVLVGEKVGLKLAKAGGVPRLDLILEALPDEWWMTVTTRVPDKEKIRSALNAGESILGANLIRSQVIKWSRIQKELK
jgi:hypothetical protein